MINCRTAQAKKIFKGPKIETDLQWVNKDKADSNFAGIKFQRNYFFADRFTYRLVPGVSYAAGG